jgi:hypothetical protein
MAGPLAKGSPILEMVQMIKATQGEEGLARLLNMLDPKARELFSKPILGSDWYPLDPWVAFLEVIHKELNRGDDRRVIAGSAKIFERQLKGVYRFFIQHGSPAGIVKRVLAVHETYFKGVGAEVVACDSQAACIRYTGFSKQHRILGLTFIGFFTKALEMSGAKDIKAVFTVPIEAGGPYAELSLTWQV